jgi:hypothetical protein
MTNWDDWAGGTLLSHLVSCAHWVADADQCARHRQLAIDLAAVAAEVQRRYDGGPRPRGTVAADDDDRAAVLRSRVDDAGGFLAVPAGEVRDAFADPEFTLAQCLGMHSLGVHPAPARLPDDEALVVLYPELSAVGDILRTSAAVAAGEITGRPTWPTEVEARITGDRTAGLPHVVDYMP